MEAWRNNVYWLVGSSWLVGVGLDSDTAENICKVIWALATASVFVLREWDRRAARKVVVDDGRGGG